MNSKFLFFALIFLFSVSSCGKYSDGPSVSFVSKEKRLCRTWVLEKIISSNGDQSTADITLTLNTDYSGKVSYNIPNPQWAPGSDEKNITWEWLLGKFGITLFLPTIPNYANHGFSDQSQYEILRLTKQELWILDRGNLMEYHFTSK
jgi:hypothetical protein